MFRRNTFSDCCSAAFLIVGWYCFYLVDFCDTLNKQGKNLLRETGVLWQEFVSSSLRINVVQVLTEEEFVDPSVLSGNR